MDSSAASLIHLYKFRTGRRLHALREVARRAQELEAHDVASHAAMAMAHDTGVAAMELRAEAPSRKRYGRNATTLDRRVDSALVGIESYLKAQERVYGPTSERGADARRVRRELLPQGAGAIARLAFVSEYERVGALIRRAREPELEPLVARIPELPAMLAELESLNDEYGKTLEEYERDTPSSEVLLAAQARGQELLSEVVALIIGRYALLPDRRAEREALLEPILRQNEEIRLSRQRRRRPRDIDPETGIELPGSDASDASDASPGNGNGNGATSSGAGRGRGRRSGRRGAGG